MHKYILLLIIMSANIYSDTYIKPNGLECTVTTVKNNIYETLTFKGVRIICIKETLQKLIINGQEISPCNNILVLMGVGDTIRIIPNSNINQLKKFQQELATRRVKAPQQR